MPPRTTFSRQRAPIILTAFVGASALFIGLKWRAVLQRSEAAKISSSSSGTAMGADGQRQEVNYSVAPGRSGGGI